MLRNLKGGKRILVASDKGGTVYGIDPDHAGAIVWKQKIAAGGVNGGTMWGGASDEHGVGYIGISDFTAGKPEIGGGLIALRLATGEKLWRTPAPPPTCRSMPGCSAAQPAPVTVIPGVAFLGSWDGHIRAYETVAGQDRLGFRYRARFRNRQRSESARRLDQQHGAGGCRGVALHHVRVLGQRDAGKCAARLFRGGEISAIRDTTAGAMRRRAVSVGSKPSSIRPRQAAKGTRQTARTSGIRSPVWQPGKPISQTGRHDREREYRSAGTARWPINPTSTHPRRSIRETTIAPTRKNTAAAQSKPTDSVIRRP